MNQPPFKPALRHQYDTPTFKTNALRLVSNEGRLKRLLLLNGQYSPSLAITGEAFRYFNFESCDTPTFKTESLRLVSYKGRVKSLLLIYKRLI